MSEENKVELPVFYAQKAGMTRIFDEVGKHIPVTVVKLIPNVISLVRTSEKDGYEAYQLAFGEKREKLVTKPVQGQLKKAGVDKFLTKFSEVKATGVDVANLGVAIAILFAGTLSVVYIFIGGISFILSGGQEDKIKQSVHTIRYAIIGLIVNVASVFILHDDHHHHGEPHHHHDHDHNMKAAYFHVLADTLTSLLAIVALLVGKYIGLLWMDPLMGIVGAIVIFRWSYGLIKESSEVLLDKSVKKPTLDKISDALSKKNTVINDIHVWKIATGHQAAILKVTSGEPLDSEEYERILNLKQVLYSCFILGVLFYFS